MTKFGLKLGIGETALIPAAQKLRRHDGYDFLELYVPMTSVPSDAENWRWYDGLLVLHAPHALGGFNFAKAEMETGNFRCLESLETLRASMSPGMIVFHPGLDGDIGETFRQIKRMREEFPGLHRIALLENKPKVGLNGEECLGASPEEIQEMLGETGCGFCLDVRHAFAYAAWAREDGLDVVKRFAKLSPRLWHAADGMSASAIDSHDHIGEGDIPWGALAAHWGANAMVTLECKKDADRLLDDFVSDRGRLREATI